MISLPNGCSCSELAVFPKNWKTKKAPLSVDWYIQYRFYDPTYKDHPKIKGRKQVILKGGTNKFKVLEERQDAIRTVLANEKDLLLNKAYNPITGHVSELEEIQYEINPNTPFILALRGAHKKLDKAKSTLSDISSVITGVEKAATHLRYVSIPISEISRKHFKQIFTQCATVIPGWSAKRFNKYRSYLMMLFTELIELEATEIDPLSKIKKKKTTKLMRQVPTLEERKKISEYLHENYYTFWRFMQIFFHSGARESELMLIKKEDVDLKNQRYKVVIKKGREQKEVLRTIKDRALDQWTEIINEAMPNQYLFAKGLQPGFIPISPIQITRRWRMHVKNPDKLGINKDFYSLKHLNLDETAAILSKEDAARMAGHTTTIITLENYLVGEKDREHHRLKKVNNSFS